MTDVKIYTITSDDLSPPITGEGFCTDMVRHSDYAALLAERDQLAAENAALKSAFDKPQAYLSWHAIPPTWEDPLPCGEYLDVHDEAGHKNSDGTDCWPVFAKSEIETPATDAWQREQMARGVDAAIAHLHKKFEGTGHIGVPVMALEYLAQQLRNGEAV